MKLTKEERSKIGKKAKRKGNKYELKIAKMIGEAFGVPYEQYYRTPRSGGGSKKGDMTSESKKMDEIFDFHVECKSEEGWNLKTLFDSKIPRLPSLIVGWIEQVKKDAGERDWILVFSKNYYPDLVLIESIIYESCISYIEELGISTPTYNIIEVIISRPDQRYVILSFVNFLEIIDRIQKQEYAIGMKNGLIIGS